MNNPGPIHIEHAPHDKRQMIITWSPASEETKRLPLVFHRLHLEWLDHNDSNILSLPIDQNQFTFPSHWNGRVYASIEIVNQEDETGLPSASCYADYSLTPDMPRNLTMIRTEHNVTFSWQPPESDSEAEDIRYAVIIRHTGETRDKSVEITRQTVDTCQLYLEIDKPGIYEVSVQARRYIRLYSHKDVGYLDSAELIQRFSL